MRQPARETPGKMTKDDRMKRAKQEEKRLLKAFGEIPLETRIVVMGLVSRAGYLKASLEELELDLIENGFTEKFSQGDQEPYDRKRPSADLYNTMSTNYNKIISQLNSLLPKVEKKGADNPDDKEIDQKVFDQFVKSRG